MLTDFASSNRAVVVKTARSYVTCYNIKARARTSSDSRLILTDFITIKAKAGGH